MQPYREHAPPAALFSWLECGWSFEGGPALTAHFVPPDGCLDVIYQRAIHQTSGELRVIGAMTREQRCDLPPGARIAGVRFRPGMAAPFLGVSPAELTDGSVSLEDLSAGRAREVIGRMDDAESLEAAASVLLSSFRTPRYAPDPVQKAIASITDAAGRVDLDTTASQANLSPRQFRRRCLEASGLTPKLLCRILRFRRAYLAALAVARPNWPAIAMDADYFDQAHLIQEFRAFTGRTPMAVFSNTRNAGAA